MKTSDFPVEGGNNLAAWCIYLTASEPSLDPRVRVAKAGILNDRFTL
jgi:hypothetical protein